MRKIILSLAAAGAALAIASPAAAQYHPQSFGYGYNDYDNYGGVRSLQARIDAVQWQINRLDRYNGMRGGDADRLREETRNIEYRLHRAERYGLNPYEANGIQTQIARLEQRVRYASANRYGNNGGDGYGHHDERDGRWDHDQNDD